MIRRGEVWWAELPPPAGRRPVVLLGRDAALRVRSLVTVAFVTTHVRGLPVEVPLGPSFGLPRECAANLDLINTVKKAHLRSLICMLPAAKIAEVDRAARFALALAG